MENVNKSDFVKQRWQERGLGFRNPWLNAAGISKSFLFPSSNSLWKGPHQILSKCSFKSFPAQEDSAFVLWSKSFKHFASWSNCFWLSDHSSIQTWSYFKFIQPRNASRVMGPSIALLPCDIPKLRRWGSRSPGSHFQPCFWAQKALPLY